MVGAFGRIICAGTLLLVGVSGYSAEVVIVPVRNIDGNMDARARMQTVHSEMQRECGASPNSARCHRLKREFQQEAKNCQKRRRK
jgi:hypothetical protein